MYSITRFWMAALVLAGVAMLMLPAPSARAQQAQTIDCASSALPMPTGFSGECKTWNERGTGNYGCSKINYLIRAADAQPGPRFFSRVVMGTKGCGMVINDPLDTLKKDAAVPRTDATNWSDQRKGDGTDVYWTFDSVAQKQNGKCFAYHRNGPTLTAKSGTLSYYYVVIGFFCKAPGQPLDDAGVRAILKTVQVNSRYE